jgi:hypothetical protein
MPNGQQPPGFAREHLTLLFGKPWSIADVVS